MGYLEKHITQTRVLYGISIILAILSLFAFKLFSLVMPILTFLILWNQGGMGKLKIVIPSPFIFALLLIVLAGVSLIWVEHKSVALKTFFALCASYVFSLVFINVILRSDASFFNSSKIVLYFAGFTLLVLVSLQICFSTFFANEVISSSLIVKMMKPTGSIIGLFSFIVWGLLLNENKKVTAALLLLVIYMVIYLTKCQTALYSLFIGGCAFLFSYSFPIIVTRMFMVGSYTFLILTPLLYSHIITASRVIEWPIISSILANSLYHRLLVWEWYSKQILENSIFGLGLESGRSFSSKVPMIIPNYKMTIHAHNNSLQAFAELGILGGLCFALFVSSVFWMVERNVKDRLSVAVCNATIIFAFMEAQITHNLWRNYWISLLVIAAGYTILLIKNRAGLPHAEGGRSKQSLTQYLGWGLPKSQ